MASTTLMTQAEPSDKALISLMKEVAKEAKKKALKVRKQLNQTIKEEIEKAALRMSAKA